MRFFPVLILGLVACGGSPETPAEEELPPRDLLLLTLDTLRADHLSCYGYPRETSPRLDALAAEGVRFERCYAPMATTLPSHTTMLTGVPPIEHGVLANLSGRFVFERDEELLTLAEVLKNAGYRTAAFVSAFPLNPGAGLTDGFDKYSCPKFGQRSGDKTIALAKSWLAEDDTAPWFLWVHLFDPHTPYDPPPSHQNHFQDDGVNAQLSEERLVEDDPLKRLDLDLYDREVRFTDELAGELFDAVGNEAVIVVTADHGEGLHQHGIPGHGFVWNEQLRVPLILRAPGIEPRTIDAPCGLVDLAPTVLNLIQPAGAATYVAQLRGHDLLAGGENDWGMLAQSTVRKRKDEGIVEVAWITQRWKLIRRGAKRSDADEVELYDLIADPLEQTNVAEQHPAEVKQLLAALDKELKKQRSRRGGRSREGTAEEIENLQGLGYGGDNE